MQIKENISKNPRQQNQNSQSQPSALIFTNHLHLDLYLSKLSLFITPNQSQHQLNLLKKSTKIYTAALAINWLEKFVLIWGAEMPK